jgi:hypothetical protein
MHSVGNGLLKVIRFQVFYTYHASKFIGELESKIAKMIHIFSLGGNLDSVLVY